MIKALFCSRKNFLPYLIASIVFSNNLLWMAAIPYNEAPDEMDQYTVSRFIGENRRLPVFGKDLGFYWMNILTKRPVTQEGLDYYQQLPTGTLPRVLFETRTPYIIQPYLSYILSGLLIVVVKFFSNDLLISLFAARLISVLGGALTAFFTFHIAQRLFSNNHYLPSLSAIFVGFLPQFTFVSSYVNQDALTALLSTLVFFAWLKCLKCWNIKNSFFIGCLLGLVILSKLSGYGTILLTIIFILVFLKRERKPNLQNITVIILCALVVSGWFFLRNYLIYGHFWTPDFSLTQFIDNSPKIIIDHMKQYKLRISNLPLLMFFLGMSFKSFWGLFGWMTIPMPRLFYGIALGLTLAGIIGLGKIFRLILLAKSTERKIFLLMLLSFPLLFSLSIIFSSLFDLQPQGRYFFPAIAPIAIGLSWGWLSFFESDESKRKVFISLSAILIAMNILSFIICIRGSYYV